MYTLILSFFFVVETNLLSDSKCTCKKSGENLGKGSKEIWKDSIEGELYRFNDKIYKAFKEQYVRYVK